jgi:hypothetical protein
MGILNKKTIGNDRLTAIYRFCDLTERAIIFLAVVFIKLSAATFVGLDTSTSMLAVRRANCCGIDI